MLSQRLDHTEDKKLQQKDVEVTKANKFTGASITAIMSAKQKILNTIPANITLLFFILIHTFQLFPKSESPSNTARVLSDDDLSELPICGVAPCHSFILCKALISMLRHADANSSKEAQRRMSVKQR